MRIVKATYGGIDCTKNIEEKITDNKLVVRSSNNIIGDTAVGVVKYLEVEIEYENKILRDRQGLCRIYF